MPLVHGLIFGHDSLLVFSWLQLQTQSSSYDIKGWMLQIIFLVVVCHRALLSLKLETLNMLVGVNKSFINITNFDWARIIYETNWSSNQCMVQTFEWTTRKSYILKLQCLSICVGSAWKILPVTACSLWSVLGGGGRESPVKHGAGGASTGGGGGGRAGKDRAGGASTGGGGGHGRGRTGRGGARRVHYAPGSH
jgi:uncharacterized membrane protein YgcG